MTKIKIGDKVKINLDVVSQNGMFDDKEQEEEYQYISSHQDEVYIVKAVDAPAQAPIVLDHPIIGDTSFYEEELIPVKEVVIQKKEKTLKDRIVDILNSEESEEICERFATEVFESISSDDEAYSDIGRAILRAILKDDADAVLTAICGWSTKTILAKIQD